MKTPEEVEELKKHWENDPCWDLENDDGFEDYREELYEFRLQRQEEWKRLYDEQQRQIKMIRPDNPAYPCHTMVDNELTVDKCNKGLNIRTELSARALQGILSNSAAFYGDDPREAAQKAVACADALLAELNK